MQTHSMKMQTILHSTEEQAGAAFTELAGWTIPERFGSFDDEYRAIKESAAIFDLSYRGKLIFTGADRAAYLHRMLSNEVKGLEAGQSNYAFLLDAQGHVLADM